VKLYAWAVASGLLTATVVFAQDAPPERLALRPAGEARRLPDRLLGASVEALFEHLIDNPAKVTIAKEMKVAYVRFPGGSQSNYYNWRTGLIEFNAKPTSSSYLKFWEALAPKIARAFPNGVTQHEYRQFANKIGAEVILVPNLETSSVEEQTAWFHNLKEDGDVPRHIELGNEFYIGMGNDPESMRRWPDEPTTMQVMKKYRDALQPFCPEGTKWAVQAAGSDYRYAPSTHRWFQRRQIAWDENLHPEDWFDAVTIHLYPNHVATLGYDPGAQPEPTDELRARLFRSLMARVDEGTDRALGNLARRVPGKEIWITEWDPRGGSTWNGYDPVTTAMNMHLMARQTLAILRHREVTASLFFMLNFLPHSHNAVFLPDGKRGFRPTGVAIALRWFDEAANGGATFQRFIEAEGRLVEGGGALKESYRKIEAGVFRSDHGVTLIVQNVSEKPRLYGLRHGSPSSAAPQRVEVLAMPNLFDSTDATPEVQTPAPAEDILLPAYSLTRIIWSEKTTQIAK